MRIGREICLSLSESGYAIAIHYNSSENEASNLAEIIKSRGGKAACFSGDLLDQSMSAKLFEEIKQELGPVSGVVNNASLFNFDDISNVTLESWNRHMHVNALSPTLLISELSRNLPSGKVGSVVNLSLIHI